MIHFQNFRECVQQKRQTNVAMKMREWSATLRCNIVLQDHRGPSDMKFILWNSEMSAIRSLRHHRGRKKRIKQWQTEYANRDSQAKHQAIHLRTISTAISGARQPKKLSPVATVNCFFVYIWRKLMKLDRLFDVCYSICVTHSVYRTKTYITRW